VLSKDRVALLAFYDFLPRRTSSIACCDGPPSHVRSQPLPSSPGGERHDETPSFA
jgi:hypothetical protein